MANLALAAVAWLATVWIAAKLWNWRKAYVAARSTGFPVYLSPVHINDTWWMILYPLLLPLLSTLPRSWLVPWLSLAQVWNIWKFGYDPFQDVQSDTLILATPQGNVLWTCDASLCHQFETSPSKSRVPVDAIKFFEVYGPTIGTTEGSEWKTYRKLVTSAFTSKTHAAVWSETVGQTTSLIARWSKKGLEVPIVKNSTSRLALHVISSVFFNKNLDWHEHGDGFEPAPPGHQISFEQALFTVVSRLGVLAVVPRALLGILPFSRVRDTHIAFTDWAKYMDELREAANARMAKDVDKNPKNVLESIILAGRLDSDGKPGQFISEKSVTGNIFFTMMAGHETVGNALAFALYLLAVYPEYQTNIQRDMTPLLQNRPWDEWHVDQEYRSLQGGWIGAVLKEVLRPYAVVPFITRRIVAPIRVVDSNDHAHVVPQDTIVSLDYAAAFRKPTTWPPRKDVSSEHRTRLHNSPALDFNPSRWIKSKDNSSHMRDGGKEDDDEDNNPRAPLVFPFGQGPRTCPGRTFAHIEMTAAIATILKDYDIRLVVSEQIKQSCGGNDVLALNKTRDAALATLYDKIETNITIELNEELPIRLVKR